MHTYTRWWTDDSPSPEITTDRFEDALDVVAFAEVDYLIGWKTWPEVWHLDDTGRFRCCFKASTLDGVKRWADDPSDLHRSRITGIADGGSPKPWLIVDSRPTGISQPVDAGDAAAFLRLRDELATVGLILLDAVVFDDKCHWWSMHEETSGTTGWPEPGPSGFDALAASA